ncbi:MAG: RNA polymerase sigma factor [Sphingomonas sp.]|uniref:RNA polymerase sigma factor n=1 Tax=Sphingomonas sp. TaxID=28214 RepID=UPI001B1400C0|nr:RNA polymerase sigma factor [Sphingomonas sp.]MBO9623969.1 RNA polymerase sigma factor [Sphingomonas sp.]
MRVNGDTLDALMVARLHEGDPLPPDDRVRASERLVLADLYHAQAPRLFRFFARRTDRQDAHDLVQESFARLAKADATRASPIRKPEAYLSQIATNLLRNRARAALQRSLAHHVPAEEVPLVGADLVAATEARDELNRLQNALMRLRPKTRAIFLAHRLDGQSYADIAKRTGLSIKGVEWHMTKAIAHLDRALRAR